MTTEVKYKNALTRFFTKRLKVFTFEVFPVISVVVIKVPNRDEVTWQICDDLKTYFNIQSVYVVNNQTDYLFLLKHKSQMVEDKKKWFKENLNLDFDNI